MASLLQDCTHQVFYKRYLSEILQLLYGVLKGSVLGQLLFLLYVSYLVCKLIGLRENQMLQSLRKNFRNP